MVKGDSGNEEQFHKALNYSFLILSQSGRSKKELEERLKRKGFFSEIIQKVTDRLEELNYLNDVRYAENFIETRLRRRPCGKKFLREELKEKGIGLVTINQILGKVFSDVNEELMAKELVRKKMRESRKLDEKVLYRRLQGYLLRRGFPSETVYKVLKELVNLEHGE